MMLVRYDLIINYAKIRVNNLTPVQFAYRGVTPYPRAIRSKTYRGYVKPQIIPNAIRNVIFV
jgi:hypothetical protein